MKAALLSYFKPADYTFKTCQSLAKWVQQGNITDYIVAFSQRFMQFSDVDDAEALIRFIDGLQGNVQAWVYTQKPADLQSAMQIAEQIGSTFATAS